jgi:hypothetical protein
MGLSPHRIDDPALADDTLAAQPKCHARVHS